MRLYIANKNYSSWSLRPWVLLKERGLSFEEIRLVFEPEGGHRGAFGAISPTARVPSLHDHGVVVWDSLAIAEYLAERDAGVWPEARAARAWARSAAAEMHSGFATLRRECSMSCGHRLRLRSRSAELSADLARIDALWSEGLARFGGPFLAGGRFTAVDAFFAPVAFRLQTYSLALSPASTSYAERLLRLPSMEAWYADALAEPWRDVEHDREALEGRELLADLRTAPPVPPKP